MEDVNRERADLQALAVRLEYATIAWNIGEAVITITLGVAASSIALIGFGTDSLIEVFASSVVVWHIRPHHERDDPGRTRLALRMVSVAFVALSGVLAVASIRSLVHGEQADRSIPGIIYLAVTSIVMLALAIAKRRTAHRLSSAPLASEAMLTFLDAILSASTLVGLALNAFLHWGWADPAAALVVAVAALRESRENWMEAAAIGTLSDVASGSGDGSS
jgi:divalent metal cation (Fe/Co/Zn/Cd) transporter